ncbi:MAG: ribonuclease HIII [Chlamydiales bacterium]|nr:ribonuclease HIII [Chlamydiales bacterium]
MPSCFVATIDTSLAQKMREDLAEKGFTLTMPPYTFFSAVKEGVSCTLYTSGKLTVQGKGMDEFITYYLEPEILKNVSYSYPEVNVDLTPRIGIDEAGKGDFFGPLCIAGVQAGEEKVKELISIGVRDSKQMSDAAVIALSKKIRQNFAHSIVRISPPKYNELYGNFKNLNRLLAWGHATAIGELVTKTSCQNVIIDQFASEHLVISALKSKKLDVNLTQRHGAESDPVVAAASILARAAFLQGLEELGQQIAIPLPKGASKKVLETGRIIVHKLGEEALGKVAKLHFKTRDDILRTLL